MSLQAAPATEEDAHVSYPRTHLLLCPTARRSGVTALAARVRKKAPVDLRAGCIVWSPESALKTPKLRFLPPPHLYPVLPAVVTRRSYLAGDDMVGSLRSGSTRGGTPKPPAKAKAKRQVQATQNKTTTEYEILRKRVMEENVARMSAMMTKQAAETGKPLQDFDAIARAFVYGGAQPGAPTQVKPTEKNVDPNYVPDAAEEASAEDESTHSLHNSPSKEVDDSAHEPHKKRCKSIVVAACTVSTRSRAADNTEDGSAAENTEDGDAIVNPERQDVLAKSTGSKRKRGGRRTTMGHGLLMYSRRNGGSKMPINFTAGARRPVNPTEAAKLSSECGIHIRNKMPIATHWKQYIDEKSPLINVIPDAIQQVAGKFVMDKNDDVAREVCTDILQSGVRQQRYKLKKMYWNNIKDLTMQEAVLKKPPNVDEQSWENLVTTWFDDHYQEICQKNRHNREGVKQNHTTGSRSYAAHYEYMKALNNEQEPSPIEFYKESHTNSKGQMTEKSHKAYVDMVLRRMGPHPEDHIPKTDMQIVEEVLKEHSSSSTFLSSMGVATASSRKPNSSSLRIRELEDRLANEKQKSVEEIERYQQEMERRIQDQEQKFEEMKKKQEEDLAALKKEQEEKTLAFEKKQHEMDVLVNFILRNQGKAPTAPPA